MRNRSHVDPEPAPPAPKQPSLWRNTDFLLLWTSQLVSYLGTKVSGLALPLLVLAITNSPVQAGLITSSRMLPYLLFGLPAGALADRWNRKTVMIACDTVRFFALGSVPLAWALGHLSLAQLYVVSFVQGTAFVFFNVAEIAALPRVVLSDALPRAVALDSTAGSIGSLVGPGLGGVIIGLAGTTVAGAALAYLVDSATYALSVVSLGFIRARFQEESRDAKGVSSGRPIARLHGEIVEGLRFVWSDRRLRTMALLSAALSFLYAPVSLAMIVLMRDRMHASATSIGLVFSVAAIGGLAGSITAPWLRARLTVGAIVIGSVALQSVATVPVALANTTTVMAIAWAVVFAFDPIFYTASATFRFAVTPDPLQGRMNSVFRLLAYGLEPLGAAAGGLLIVALGARAEILAVAALVAVAGIAVYFTDVRRI